jgi:hypothetical protein
VSLSFACPIHVRSAAQLGGGPCPRRHGVPRSRFLSLLLFDYKLCLRQVDRRHAMSCRRAKASPLTASELSWAFYGTLRPLLPAHGFVRRNALSRFRPSRFASAHAFRRLMQVQESRHLLPAAASAQDGKGRTRTRGHHARSRAVSTNTDRKARGGLCAASSFPRPAARKTARARPLSPPLVNDFVAMLALRPAVSAVSEGNIF